MSAERFFETLRAAGVRRVIDVRLHNTSQLSGFTKKDDLAYFLGRFGIDYVHEPSLAPSPELFDAIKGGRIEWPEYAARFRELVSRRRAVESADRRLFDAGCLLCTEPSPEHCHRRLVAEALARAWKDVEIDHLR